MTTHNEHRDELIALLDRFDDSNVERADALLAAGWRKQGAADPDVIERVAGVIADAQPTAINGRSTDAARALANAGLLAKPVDWDMIERAARLLVTRVGRTEVTRSDIGLARDMFEAAGLLAGQGAADNAEHDACSGCGELPEECTCPSGGPKSAQGAARPADVWGAVAAVTTPERYTTAIQADDTEQAVRKLISDAVIAAVREVKGLPRLTEGAADDDTTRLRGENEQLRARVLELRAYVDTTRHHQQQHAEAVRELERAVRELERVRADRDALLNDRARIRDLWEHDDLRGAISAMGFNPDELAALTQVSQPQPEPEPRRFPIGSPEPDDVHAVRSDQNGVVFKRRYSVRPFQWVATTESGGDNYPYSWWDLNGENAPEGGMSLTEVSRPQEGPQQP